MSHADWCPQIDRIFERMHMALREAGVPAKLMRHETSQECGHAHLFVRTARSDREMGRRALEVVAPPGFVDDMAANVGPELARPRQFSGTRVR
jgi:hypothetical protein